MYNARRDRRKKVQIELLEIRQMLTADYLYSLEARSGVPDNGFGVSHAANDQFHVVANFASNETYHFLTEAPDYESFFYGEIQIHDAATGDLLRTIQNPLPYGMGGFGSYGESNFRLVAPNSFGYSIDIHENLILVGSPGWESNFAIGHNDPDFETGGRAFLFDANTGDLLHTFDGSFEPVGTQGRNNDGFGRSVAIDGNRIAIGAQGPSYEDGESQIWDTDSGRAYVYSATTGNLISMVESPYLDPSATINFGATVSLSNGKLVVTEPGDLRFTDSAPFPTQVYDAETGDLLLTLGVDGFRAVIEGNNIVIYEAPDTKIVNATTGAVTQTIPAQFLDFDGNLIVSGTFGFGPTFELAIRDFPSGNALYSVPTPPDFSEAYWEFGTVPQVFEDRLLVPGRRGPENENVVFVYSVTDAPVNSPPTDIALSNNSVPENAANATVVGALTATDPTPGETLTFSMVVSAGGRFGVDGTNLVVADGSLLNFESNISHSITVRVTDSAGNVYDETYTINVTDVNEAATLISLTPNIESENTTNNALVGSLSSNDPDNAETETFVLLDDAGGRFLQDGLQIRVANASLLDFETASSHQISVRVTDSAAHVFEQLVTINIADFNYSPTDFTLNGDTVPEGVVNVHFSESQAPQVSFGSYIAASGDRFVVGMSFTPVPGQAGRAHVYSRTTGQLTATLVCPFAQSGQFVPGEVAIGGNLAFVSGIVTTGGWAVHVFNATTGGLLRTLTSPTADTVQFGVHIAISGNLIAVSTSTGNNGRVYLFDSSDGTLLETLVSPNPAGSFAFGAHVVVSGNSIVVGDPVDQVGGVVFLYEYDPGTTAATLVMTLNNPSPDAADFFGWHVERSGDRLVVSAPFDDTQATDSGLVYVFNATTGALLHTINNPTPGNGDEFGSDMAISGDRLIVTAYWDDTLATDTGAVYVFDVASGDLLATVQNPSPDPSDFFGTIALAGDTILVGASGDDTIGLNAGIVYRFDLPIAAVIGTLTGIDPEPTQTFTWSLLDDAGGRFGIDGSNLVVADPMLLNFELASFHEVTVLATDSGGATFSKTFTIQITNVAETSHLVTGTSGNDDYVLTYSSTVQATGTVTITLSTNSAPSTTIGTYPMTQSLIIDGLSGSDSVRAVGTGSADQMTVLTNGWLINDAGLRMTNIETRIIDGGAGNDAYRFDADAPLGLITLDEAGGGVDLIKFESLTSADVNVNLSLTGSQVVHPANLSLILQPINAFENLQGGSGNDLLTGNAAANTIFGSFGNDTITGAGGNDSLYGAEGDDTFIFNAVSSAEADYVAEYFNQGTDTITFASMPIDVSMNLSTLAVQTVHVGRTIYLSSAITVENLIGGAGNDVLRGNELANALNGGPGNDQLTGLTGSDSLVGGFGHDSYFFHIAVALEADFVTELDNQGFDSLMFSAVSAGVTIDLGSTAVQSVHANRTLQLLSGNAIENLIAGPGNDVLTGNGLANFLQGAGGNDILNGRSGNDSLSGNLGNDIYIFTPVTSLELDYVAEMPDQGTDTVDFSTITTPVTYDATISQSQNVHLNRSFAAQLFDVSIENVIGGSGNDVLTGNPSANTITGGPGNDTITGAGGNDLLFGGTGDDTFIFNAISSAESDFVAEYFNQGTDTISFASLPSNISMSLTTIAAQPVHIGRTLTLASAITVENLIGGSGNDLLRGNELANTLTGNAGNDQLLGGSGSDSLIGGPGDDSYVFVNAMSPESDSVTELNSEGTDMLSFLAVTSPMSLHLAAAFAQAVHANRTLQLSSGTAVENVIAGSGNDVLTGNTLANALTGSGGNDSINGAEGNDLLWGGFGDDSFLFGPASAPEADMVTEWGNQGTDTVNFSTLVNSVIFNVGSVAVQNVHLNRTVQLASAITLEIVIGGAGNDTLTGNSLANVLAGNDGNDVLLGGGGRDILIGGLGGDTLNGGLDDDILIAGRTLSALILAQLIDLQTEWVSANLYSARITNLRAGVGGSLASLQTGINVLDDSPAIDTLTGDAGLDWYFRALDDVISDLLGGEIEDLL